MNAGPKYEYLWADGTTIKKPISCSAPRYVDYLFTWVQNLLEDERIFPTEIGTPFPPDFLEYIRNIFKRLFRVYAHIYYCHFERMGQLGAEPHLNTCFKHYMYFVYEFNLIPRKEELAPLQASPPTAQPPPPPRRDRHNPNPHPNPNPNATTVTGSDRQADGRRRASVWRRRLGARRARRSRQRGGRVRHRRRTDGSVTQPHPCFPTMRSMREATTADAALRGHAI